MHPKLFEVFGIPVYSFGLMLGISFITGSMILTRELERKKINIETGAALIFFLRILYISILIFSFFAFFVESPSSINFPDVLFSSTIHFIVTVLFVGVGVFLFKKPPAEAFDLAGDITIISLLFGVVGSKIFYLFENWQLFMISPFEYAFSPGGLTWYGGFLLVTTIIFLYAQKVKISFWQIADATSPGLLWAYGIARIGCHLAGDGDYGFPTTLPWGTDYSNGTYPPSLAFKHFPEVTSKFPNGIVPDTTLCHPTPVYEFIICSVLFFFMWKYRKNIVGTGTMFMWYLVAAGAERFTIEFFRLNPRLLFGLSEAQLISVVLILIGLTGLWMTPRQNKRVLP